MKTLKFSVFELFGAYLSTREQADAIFDRVKLSSTKVIFDFKKVSFISRSFADQFFKLNSALEDSNSVNIINTSSEVQQMLSAVSRTQVKIIRKEVSYSTNVFSDKSDVKRYLLSIE